MHPGLQLSHSVGCFAQRIISPRPETQPWILAVCSSNLTHWICTPSPTRRSALPWCPATLPTPGSPTRSPAHGLPWPSVTPSRAHSPPNLPHPRFCPGPVARPNLPYPSAPRQDLPDPSYPPLDLPHPDAPPCATPPSPRCPTPGSTPPLVPHPRIHPAPGAPAPIHQATRFNRASRIDRYGGRHEWPSRARHPSSPAAAVGTAAGDVTPPARHPRRSPGRLPRSGPPVFSGWAWPWLHM